MFKYWKKSMVAAGILATLLWQVPHLPLQRRKMLQPSRAVRITTKKLSSRFRALKKAAPSGPIRTVIISPVRAITNSTVITAVPASIMSEGIKPATETI